jgi:hypothetical protein
MSVYSIRIGKFINVLLALPGGCCLEQRLNTLFAKHRVRNEFFHEAEPIRKFIELVVGKPALGRNGWKAVLANIEAWHAVRTARMPKLLGVVRQSTDNIVVPLFPSSEPTASPVIPATQTKVPQPGCGTGKVLMRHGPP